MINLKLHSVVQLITNSSTVIFTYSESALDTVKDLINEMLKVFDQKNLTADDLFYFGIFLEDPEYNYKNYLENKIENYDEDDEEYKIYNNLLENYPEDFDKFLNDILTNKIEKPQWMLDAEECEDYHSYYRNSNNLYIQSKDDKYSELANKLLKYLYSTTHEATRDG